MKGTQLGEFEEIVLLTLALPGIEGVDISSEVPHAMGFVAEAFNWEGKEANTRLGMKPLSVGYDFVKLMGLQLVEGRDFSRAIKSDSLAFMVNEEPLAPGLFHSKNSSSLGKKIGVWSSF